jgi:putative transcriptional regulator
MLSKNKEVLMMLARLKSKNESGEQFILLNNIRKLRFFADELSQEDLANRVGVSRQTIYAIEKGKFNPSVKLALRIAKFFQKSLEEVFYLTEVKNDQQDKSQLAE